MSDDTKNKNVLIVEDDEVTALNLSISLKKQGYTVIRTCYDIDSAKDTLLTIEPDIIIVDISLKESCDGIDFAKHLRSNYHIPFIFLTSYSDDAIIFEAKLTEPYGYIVKPFDPNSLHATMQMALFKFEMENKRKEKEKTQKLDKLNLEELLHSKRSADRPIVPFGEDYHLDITVCETFYKDKKIKLTKKENAFLRLLVAQLGRVVTFGQAVEYVWDEQGATENSVRTLVWRLRNKLETNIIKNASGIGYCIEE
ncbi:MAG: response regulator [Sulfurimonadaceae bacterium]|jgi:DNA-binding response OmpR family regulator|nr:response regulator [Sulfurimonadaceae bacterium]